MAIFLHRMTGMEDFALSLPVAARTSVSRSIPGMVANLLPLRLAVSPRMSVLDLVRQAADRIRDALEHEHFPIAEMCAPDGPATFGPVVNIMRFKDKLSFAGNQGIVHNLAYGPVEDLSITVHDRSDGAGLQIDFDANTRLYDVGALADHQQRYLRVLAAAVAAPEQPIGSLDILSAEERRTILRDMERHCASACGGDAA